MIRRAERGRLKLYLGYSPGVGKTYAMLQEAHRLKQEGLDIVVGLVETHGRADTAALLSGLEIIPGRMVTYRGIVLEEMDVDAILDRAPKIVLVDELAHTNPPESKHPKRYMDVDELLANGINVISTMNVQHLESLYNTVEGLVQIRVSERIPDSVLKQADEIVNVDLSAKDLIKRLERGKIYPQERIAVASQNYFLGPKLEQLRELTLREAASQIDIRRREQTDAGSNTGSDQIVVCLSSSGSNNANLLRYGSRLAGKLNRRWYAVHVQTPREGLLKIDASKQRVLADALTLANQLGAMVFTLKGANIPETILRFAREYRIGHIVIGRPIAKSWWRRLCCRPDNAQKLIQKGEGFRIVVLDERLPENDQAMSRQTKSMESSLASDPAKLQLTEANLLVWNKEVTKQQAISDLFDLLLLSSQDKIKREMFDQIVQRENEMSTFLNEGLAIPHAVIPGLDRVFWAVGLPRQGISDAGTVPRIQLVVLALYSPEHSREYLTGVATISSILRITHNVDTLKSVQRTSELLEWVNLLESERETVASSRG